MGTPKMRGWLLISLASLLLAGCASNEPEDSAPEIAPDTGGPESMSDAVDAKKPPKPMVKGEKLLVPTGSAGTMDYETLEGIFYFDFDQAIVKRTGHSELNKHASALQSNRMLWVRLEGHADERGTREYNLALGERRANSIRAYLVAQGVSSSQIEVISYGEEKPVVGGHSESSWSQNRRVEIVYR